MDSCVGVYGIARCNSEVGKVVFEFSEEEDLLDINLVVNRKRMMSAIWEISNYIRELNKGYARGTIIVSGDKVLGDISCSIPEEYMSKEKKFYVEDEEIIRKLESLIHPLDDLIDKYY